MHLLVREHVNVGDEDTAPLKIFTEDTKVVFELCNLIKNLYDDDFGITLDDFSKD